MNVVEIGGEGGIRTHGELPHTAFRVRRTRPLCDLSSASAIMYHSPVRRATGLFTRVLINCSWATTAAGGSAQGTMEPT